MHHLSANREPVHNSTGVLGWGGAALAEREMRCIVGLMLWQGGEFVGALYRPCSLLWNAG